MAHKVDFTVPERSLGNSDIEFSVYTEEGKLGTLRISKGGIDWYPKWKQ